MLAENVPMFLNLNAVIAKFPGQLEKNHPICHFTVFIKPLALGFGRYFVFKYESSLNTLGVRDLNTSDKTIKLPYQNIISLFPSQFFLLRISC